MPEIMDAVARITSVVKRLRQETREGHG
jgi:hypothetical protein